MQRTCFFCVMSLTIVPRMKSIVSVELDVMTSEESVDIDAERTRMTVSAISPGPSPESIAGIIASKPSFATSTLSPKSRPKPPRK